MGSTSCVGSSQRHPAGRPWVLIWPHAPSITQKGTCWQGVKPHSGAHIQPSPTPEGLAISPAGPGQVGFKGNGEPGCGLRPPKLVLPAWPTPGGWGFPGSSAPLLGIPVESQGMKGVEKPMGPQGKRRHWWGARQAPEVEALRQFSPLQPMELVKRGLQCRTRAQSKVTVPVDGDAHPTLPGIYRSSDPGYRIKSPAW